MNYNSKEFYINMKEKDIPKWDPLYTYDEQDDDVKQFWDNEALKLTEGVTINGVYIHPWLYWHLNFWHMMLDKGMDRVPGLSSLRDNEWFFAEMLQKAEEQNKAIFMFGTRRFGKALLNSEILYMEQGEKTIGEALVGDKIYDDAGNLTEITGVYPQGRVMTYKVTFEDGRNCICCGDHLWRVKRLGSWKVLSLKSLIVSNYKECSIQLCEAIDYPDAKLPIAPNAYGAMMAAYLSGDFNDIVLNKSMNRLYIRSSRRQKKIFVESFIKYMGNIVTSNEKFCIKNIDYTILHFVKQMFWSCGWYASFNDGFLTLSSTKKEIAITSIEIYGNHEATCITVSNQSRLFLTTNYIVTHNSAIMSSFLARNATMTYNLTHNVICASADDLLTLTEYLEFGLDNMHPFLKINRTGNNWDKEVVLGTRNIRNERDVHARIRITNIDQGKTAASLKTAGGTPFTSIYDEVGKFPFLNAYLAGKPAHMANGRMRGMILAAGCCCAGTVVYKASGEPCYIEDLRQTDGIIGYDIETGKLSIEDIEWMKPPSSKPCRRLATAMGRIIECSIDHPILVLDYFTQKPKFVRADRIVPGDEICVSSAAGGRVLGEEGFPVESIDLYEKGIIIEPIVSNINIGNKLVYNLTASNTHTYLANGIITHNTGGNVEKSQDAQKVMNNPASYGFMVMDYDLLNKRCVTPTWRICKSGCFVPGQMSHAYPKDKTTLDKYLGKENSPMLKKIPISVTNYERSTAKIKEDLEGFSKSDKELFIQTKMAYPLTIDDCFLNAAVNRFPIEDATIHKNRLLEQGRPGQLVDVFQLEGKKMGWKPSDKMLAPFPFKGGNIDCPVVMYEEPPKEGGNFDDYVYVSGCLPPGEVILTDNGWKPVEEVGLNDRLVDREGNYVKIHELMNFDKDNTPLYSIGLKGTYRNTRVTEEHPVYVSDDISIHGYALDEKRFNFRYLVAKDVKPKMWTMFPNIYTKVSMDESKMGGFKNSIELWWLIGLWYGDGYICENTITYCINSKEDYVIERIKKSVGILFGEKSVNLRRRTGCFEVSFNDKVFSDWINSNFGKYADGKYIPEWVKYLPKEYKLSLIQGYLDSDGSVTIHTKGYVYMEFVSINLALLEDIQHILFSLGIIGCITMLRDRKERFLPGAKKISITKPCYHLRIGNYYSIMFRDMVAGLSENYIYGKLSKIGLGGKKPKRKNVGMFFSKDNSKIFIQIDKVEMSLYSGKVYNYHCENNNYCCKNINLHNCDPYKQDKANTESLGALYILKRYVTINDPFAYKIVASYVSRPPKSDDFCRNCEILIEGYGAKCLMENADRMFELYLARRNKEMLLLEDGEKVASKIIRPGARQNNRLGLSPTVPNQRMLYNAVLQYCWEEVVVGFDEDGNEIKQKGIYRIDDIELLEEMIAFGPGVNTDRIVAFGHALLLAKYYDDMNFMPKSTTEKMNQEKVAVRKLNQYKGFVLRRHNPFKMRM